VVGPLTTDVVSTSPPGTARSLSSFPLSNCESSMDYLHTSIPAPSFHLSDVHIVNRMLHLREHLCDAGWDAGMLACWHAFRDTPRPQPAGPQSMSSSHIFVPLASRLNIHIPHPTPHPYSPSSPQSPLMERFGIFVPPSSSPSSPRSPQTNFWEGKSLTK
jgi:hypothetical protein